MTDLLLLKAVGDYHPKLGDQTSRAIESLNNIVDLYGT
jgi:hypothetical protein